jgi:hypothetical protein
MREGMFSEETEKRQQAALEKAQEFYELGRPEDWKELLKYARFYLVERNEERKTLIFLALQPTLGRRGQGYGDPDEILRALVPTISEEEKERLQKFISDKEKELYGNTKAS